MATSRFHHGSFRSGFARRLAFAACSLLGLLAALPGRAAPVLYTDEAAFTLALADAGLISIQLDDFEDVAAGGAVPLPFERAGYRLSEASGGGLVFESGASVIAGDRSLRSTNVFGSGQIRFDFTASPGSLVNAFALRVGGVEIGVGDDLHFWIDGVPRPFPLGTLAPSVVFLGVIDVEATFSEVVVAKQDTGASYVIDDVQLALVVPEPSTAMLVGCGLVALARRPRRS